MAAKYGIGICAVLHGARWRIARAVPAKDYGKSLVDEFGPDTMVWSEDQTTACLGPVGEEDHRIYLP